MRKIYLVLFIFLFLPSIGLCIKGGPSFEVYPPGDSSYPLVESPSVEMTGTHVIITAVITDVSGVALATAIIKDSSGVEIDRESMHNDGSHFDGGDSSLDDIFGAIVYNVKNYPIDTYTVSLLVMDNLENQNPDTVYSGIGTFQVKTSNATKATKIHPFTSTPSASAKGATVSLSATLTYDDGTPLSGETITFTDKTDSIAIGSAITADSSGLATTFYTISMNASIGNHTLQADYAGNESKDTLPSSTTIVLPIVQSVCAPPSNGATLCIILSASANDSNISSFTVSPSNSISIGTQATFSATITGTGNGETVYFRDDTTGNALGSGTTISNTATFTYTPSFSGAHTIRAIYNGNSLKNLPPSTKTLTLTVTGAGNCSSNNGANLCVTVSSSNPATVSAFIVSPSDTTPGQTVTLTATMATGTGAGETVYFRDDTAGATIGSAITNSSGVATFSYNPSFTGTHVIEAIYQGNPSRNLSPSYKTGSLVITGNCSSNNGANLCVTVSSSNNAGNISFFTVSPSSSVSAGTQVTLSATITGTGSGETVYFRDDTAGLVLGSGTTSSNTATFQYKPAFNGPHTIEAIYQGNAFKNLLPAAKTLTLTVTGNCSSNNGATICTTISQSTTPP